MQSVRAKYSLKATVLHRVESLRARRDLISAKPLDFDVFLSLLGLPSEGLEHLLGESD